MRAFFTPDENCCVLCMRISLMDAFVEDLLVGSLQSCAARYPPFSGCQFKGKPAPAINCQF